jgi:hypothetical protein
MPRSLRDPLAELILSSVPPNVQFEIDDLEEPWNFSRKFDYIHSRIMTLSFRDWKAYLQKCYE